MKCNGLLSLQRKPIWFCALPALLKSRCRWEAVFLNINHLIEFIYLAETLSFKATADYFYVSRSVISRHLAAIEDTLGVKLLERGNQSVRLTEAGKVFHREAQTVLRAYADAVDCAREAGNAINSTVHIGYLKNAARPFIVQFARYMRHEHPGLPLDLVCMEYGDLRRAMDEGAVDIAVAVNLDPRVSRNYRSTKIYTDRFFAVMGKDHPLASRTEGVELSELPSEKLLLPDSFVYAGLSEFIGKLVNAKAQASAREYYRDVDMLYLKVQAEGFVALSSSMNNAMFGDRLAIIPVKGVDTTFTVSAFYSDDLPEKAYHACCKGFESCRDAMREWGAAKGEPPVGFSLAMFD